MRTLLALSILLGVILSGCGSKTPVNGWQIESTSSFESYTQSFLEGDSTMGQNYLQSAIKSAKQSANTTQLSRIYLAACALERSVGSSKYCQNYRRLASMEHNPQHEAYYRLLTGGLHPKDIAHLPPDYRTFANYSLQGDTTKAFEAIMGMKKPTSKLIAASLLKSQLTHPQRAYLLTLSSQHGYKTTVLYWLKEIAKYGDPHTKADAKRKIELIMGGE